MKNSKKLDNSGAALVLVIVVIAFISVSATILLFISSRNYFMKATDINTKESFYIGEKAMEEIKAQLMVDASLASEIAFKKSLLSYNDDSSEQCQAIFSQAFVSAMKDIWDTRVGVNSDMNAQAYLESVIDSAYSSSGELTVSNETNTAYTIDGDKFSICGVGITYTDSDGYFTSIVSDFVVTPPEINFGMEPQVMVGSDPLGNPIMKNVTSTLKTIDCVVYSNWVKR